MSDAQDDAIGRVYAGKFFGIFLPAALRRKAFDAITLTDPSQREKAFKEAVNRDRRGKPQFIATADFWSGIIDEMRAEAAITDEEARR